MIGLFIVAIPLFIFPTSFQVQAALRDQMEDDEIYMVKGDLETIKTFGLTRISIIDPAVADTVSVDSDHILLVAKGTGQTTFFIWDKYGKRSFVVYVFDEDLDMVKSRLQQLLAEANIKGIFLEINKKEGKVVVSGEIDEDQKGDLDKLLSPFGISLMNLVKAKKEENLVQIDAQISELNSSYSKNMGFEWTSALTYKETLPGFNPSAPTDFFKIGNFSRTTQIIADINALITEGKGKVLSKPKLVCVSGKEASFLVGGEIPVTTTTTSSGGNVQENIQYRKYGIELSIKPTIRGNKVDINLGLEVSDIDASNAVGKNVAFTTRSTDTQLYLENGQTVILAGLIKHNENKTVKRIPILSDIPVLGAIFRSRKNTVPETETELVISLTPTILTNNGDIITPEDYSVSTTDVSGASTDQMQDQARESSLLFQNATSKKSAVPQELASYIQLIQQRIAQQVVYPDKARQYGWEGTVKLALHLLRDGTLIHAVIKEPSGYDLFDDQALNIAKNLAPYASFPSDSNLQELTLTIPIVYSLEQ